MTENKTPGTEALMPHLICDGAADALEFYKRAFGAEEMMRLPGPDGKLMHGAVSVNGAMVMLMDEFPEQNALSPRKLGGTPVTLHLNVPDVDAWVARAVEAGATVVMPVQDQFWGDRYGVIEDPFPHNWALATPQRDTLMTESELREAMARAQPM